MRAPHWLVLVTVGVVGYVLWRKFGHKVTGAVTAATK